MCEEAETRTSSSLTLDLWIMNLGLIQLIKEKYIQTFTQPHIHLQINTWGKF